MRYLPGIENISSVADVLKGKRLGLITNPSGVDSNLNSDIDIINKEYKLAKLFAPEHGIRGDIQAGIKVPSYVDDRTGIEVVSVFGENHDTAMNDIDCMVYDLQDVGARHFSYPYLMGRMMKKSAERGIPFVVLDRYNPVGLNKIAGNIFNDKFSCGFGGYSLATRYGMTIGELAQYINTEYKVGCELHIAPCVGLERYMDYRHLRPHWILPGPNCPTYETAVCYLGSVLFEGTNVAEGRGTTRPFELIGAPWMNNVAVVEEMRRKNLPGVAFRTSYFTPTFAKYKGELCRGLQMHVTDFDAFEPYLCTLLLVDTIKKYNPEQFKFHEPKEEGEHSFYDKLSGASEMREDGFDPIEYVESQKPLLEAFKEKCKPYYLYK